MSWLGGRSKHFLLPILAAAMVARGTLAADAATNAEVFDGAFNLKGSLGVEERIFALRPAFDGQDRAIVQTSLTAAADATWTSDDKRLDVDISPFLRLDDTDEKRTHWDLREAAVNYYAGAVDLRVGISKVYWGVTESHQLVDIVNQSDMVEEPRGTEKLGQPMVMLRGRVDAIEATALLLPAFRPRTFPGVDGRLRPALVIDGADAQYESSAGTHRLDSAVRLKARIDDFDVGLSFFDGTSREPRFEFAGGKLVPVYDVIDQVGLDLQATLGATLLKLEAISRDGYRGPGSRRFSAVVAGVEQTFAQAFDSAADVGLVLEYNWDDRPPSAPPTIYDNDFFLGARFAFNDVGDSSGILGTLIDAEKGSVYARLEGSTRIRESLRLEFEGEFVIYASDLDGVLQQFKDDSFITIRLKQYL